jgi:hypothetical protein
LKLDSVSAWRVNAGWRTTFPFLSLTGFPRSQGRVREFGVCSLTPKPERASKTIFCFISSP